MAAFDPEKARRDFPSLAFLLDDPEIGNLIRQFYQEDWHLKGDEGSKWFQRRMYETQWWRTRSTSAREILALEQTDPAEYSRRLDLSRARVQQLLANLGAWVPPDRQDWIARRALAENLSEFEIRWMITQGEWRTGQSSPVAHQVRAAFAQYLVPFNESLNNAAVGNIINQQWTLQNLEEVLREQAIRLYPHLEKQLTSGLTMQQITNPYKSIIASTLELSPENVDFTDPRYRAAIDYIDEQGNHRLMTITEAERWAMQQPEYRKTRGAREKGAEIGQAIARELGRAPA